MNKTHWITVVMESDNSARYKDNRAKKYICDVPNDLIKQLVKEFVPKFVDGMWWG
jgi:predicted DNA-binding protein (MmcQ/YjbR family)